MNYVDRTLRELKEKHIVELSKLDKLFKIEKEKSSNSNLDL